MSGGQPNPDRRSALPTGLAHATSRRLQRLLADVPTPFTCKYACMIHPRRRVGEHGFGVITLSGESLPLTVEMLASLRHVRTLYEGRAPVVVGPAQMTDSVIPSDDGEWAVPLPVARLAMRMLPEEPPDDQTGSLGGTEQIVTPSAEGPQLTLLCAQRPAGWPA